MKEDCFEVDGRVLTALRDALFEVKIDGFDDPLMCHISGKIRKNSINILPGDKVRVVISKYDITKGRIVFRMKG